MADDGSHREGRIPVEVVRDLLAIARTLYATLQGLGPGYANQLLRLKGIGFQLNLAVERAGQGGPGTFANRCAWLIAEKAAADLGEMVDVHLPAKVLIKAAGGRLTKKRA